MKTALVLSGGGAGGAFQIGVLQKIWAAEKENISSIYGTSVGSLNAAALRWIDLDALVELWLGIKGRSDLMALNPLAFLGLARGKYKTKKLKYLTDSLFELEPRNPQIRVQVSVVSLRTGDISYIEHSAPNFKDMVLASASVPFHMEPVGEWVDGGVRDHTPIQRAIDDGYKRIIVICTNPWSRKQRDSYNESWPYLLNIGLRSTDILQSELLHGDLLQASSAAGIEVLRFAPDVRIIETFEYDPQKIRAAISQGFLTNGKS